MGSITINGKTFAGSTIAVRGNTIYIDGKEVSQGVSGDVHLHVTGDVQTVSGTNLTINGNVKGNADGTNITISGDVGGDVDGTNVNCGKVSGSVKAINIDRR